MASKQSNEVTKRSEFISIRASTRDRMIAEELQNKLKLRSQAELLRLLLQQKAELLGIG
jgi:hypothetical protein